MKEVDRRREQLGLAAIFMIISHLKNNEKISSDDTKSACKILKDFDRSGVRTSKGNIKWHGRNRWKDKSKCTRWPDCGGKCVQR